MRCDVTKTFDSVTGWEQGEVLLMSAHRDLLISPPTCPQTTVTVFCCLHHEDTVTCLTWISPVWSFLFVSLISVLHTEGRVSWVTPAPFQKCFVLPLTSLCFTCTPVSTENNLVRVRCWHSCQCLAGSKGPISFSTGREPSLYVGVECEYVTVT